MACIVYLSMPQRLVGAHECKADPAIPTKQYRSEIDTLCGDLFKLAPSYTSVFLLLRSTAWIFKRRAKLGYCHDAVKDSMERNQCRLDVRYSKR